jgi:hypothetical protein
VAEHRIVAIGSRPGEAGNQSAPSWTGGNLHDDWDRRRRSLQCFYKFSCDARIALHCVRLAFDEREVLVLDLAALSQSEAERIGQHRLRYPRRTKHPDLVHLPIALGPGYERRRSYGDGRSEKSPRRDHSTEISPIRAVAINPPARPETGGVHGANIDSCWRSSMRDDPSCYPPLA